MKWSKWHLILILFFVTGCHRSKNVIPESMLSGEVVIAADEALMPLMKAELAVFQNFYKYSTVDCKYLSEYDAINLLLQEKTRLAIIARPLNQKENDFLKSKQILPESIPLAYDAVALIVHSDNKAIALTTGQIAQIMSGTITDWNQLNVPGKSGTIQLVYDAEASGVLRYLNEKLNLNNKISGDIKFAGDSRKVIELVTANANAIGFIGYSWLSEIENMKVQETLTKVSLVAVSATVSKDGQPKSYVPSVSSIYNNTYPLIRKVYAIYTDPSASLARGLLAHLTSERGQKIIYRCGLKPENDFQRLISIKKE